uniref:Uncharacterized protein n=1 Tax=Candidatus Kentrum sp. MB TaxID=2138164 RepID=A0A451B7K6_9GAMM|nr:MAG: hypothetical protein BECKMB1821I_GA0114274_100620 [Candidatus Kentron sp. MB]VFK74217.1 MAG: hypothetical protein BECKMB1821H_GA0114242_100238 [Candidatus Kentron sp. MB]
MSRYIPQWTVVLCLSLGISQSQAQDGIASSSDCSHIDIPYTENANLTREERIALMDQAFFDSLEQFELCQSARNSQGGGGGAGGGGGGSAGGGTASGSPNDGSNGGTTTESFASSDIAGTEEPMPPPVAKDLPDLDTDPEQTAGIPSEDDTRPRTLGSGKAPEDIPPADNDDALAAQIRHAAENERDPKKRARLWNEYRKYKGLPTKR